MQLISVRGIELWSTRLRDSWASKSAAGHKAATDHVKTHRPWGTYQTLCPGERFLVKKTVVEPGGKLSLQKHHHRAEHWVVVGGTAEVTIDKKMFHLHENESAYIPVGTRRRAAPLGTVRASEVCPPRKVFFEKPARQCDSIGRLAGSRGLKTPNSRGSQSGGSIPAEPRACAVDWVRSAKKR
jgi:mannose-6-phosphate isomerase-like protein (cupin superfamily)